MIVNSKFRFFPNPQFVLHNQRELHCNSLPIGESWGMANDGEWRTGQYLEEGVKAIKCFHPRMLTPLMARINTN